MKMKSSNPAFNSGMYKSSTAEHAAVGEAMTISGTINKTAILAALVLASSVWSWMNGSTTIMIVGAVGGLITGLITAFRPQSASITAPIYALFEGMFLGVISAYFEASYGGIVFQAVSSTFGVLFMMLFLYRTGVIKATARFKMGVVAATGGIMIMYLLNFVLSFFGGSFLSLENNSLMMIGINLVVVGVAALNLILDFDFIEQGAAQRAPKQMEWYGAFGLLVTLIWLYIELLKLLSRLSSRD